MQDTNGKYGETCGNFIPILRLLRKCVAHSECGGNGRGLRIRSVFHFISKKLLRSKCPNTPHNILFVVIWKFEVRASGLRLLKTTELSSFLWKI